MIDEQIFFNQPVKGNFKTYNDIWKIVTCQGDDYTTSCLLDYNYFNKYYKIIGINLRKQKELETDPIQ